MDQSKLIKQFIKETKSHLTSIEKCLINLEKPEKDTGDKSEEIGHLFMGFHGIKGISDIVGHPQILSLSHQAEDVLSDLRDGSLQLERSHCDILLIAHDLIRDLINKIKLDSHKFDDISDSLRNRYQVLMNQLQSISGVGEASTNLVDAGTSSKKKMEEQKSELKRKVSEPDLVGLKLSFKQASIDHLNILRRFCENFELMSVNKSEWRRINRTLKLFESSMKSAKMDLLFEDFYQFKQILNAAESGKSSQTSLNEIKNYFQKLKDCVMGREHKESAEDPDQIEIPAQTLLRSEITIEAKTADQLVSDVSDLSVLKNDLDHKLVKLRRIDGTLAKEYLSIAKSLGKISGNLQKNVLELRMVSVSQLFARIPRMIRDLSRSCGKEVDLEMAGEHTRIDYHVMECLIDPLVHMIRNSMDHGIERPEERKRLGKGRAKIRLEAFRTRGRVVIEVTDDGKGLDRNKIVEKALKLGIVSEKNLAKMTEDETLNLIFHPGLSTAEKTTTISGRGVGMASVREHLEKIQGSVTLSSIAEKGTRIQLSVPLTLAIEPSILIESSDVLYAIPMSKVSESLRIQKHMYDKGKLSNLIGYRGDVLPIIDLAQLFSENEDPIIDRLSESNDQMNRKLCVVQSDSGQLGIVVDRILESQELLIKPLPPVFKSVRGFSGASTLGDGRMILMLDSESIRELSLEKQKQQNSKMA